MIIVAKTNPDIGTLLDICKKVLGRSVAEDIENKIATKDNQKYLSALGRVLNEDLDYNDHMSNLGLLLPFYSYTFAVVVDSVTYNNLLQYRRINIVGKETIKQNYLLAIMSGDLSVWRDSVIDGSTINTSSEVRDIFNKIHVTLCNEGLSKLWTNYTKTKHKDNTIILTSKK